MYQEGRHQSVEMSAKFLLYAEAPVLPLDALGCHLFPKWFRWPRRLRLDAQRAFLVRPGRTFDGPIAATGNLRGLLTATLLWKRSPLQTNLR